MTQDQLFQAFAQWAQAKKIPVPQTAAGKKVLFARFMSELHACVGAAAQDLVGSDSDLAFVSDGATVQLADRRMSPEYSDFDKFVDDREEAMRQAGGDDLAANIIHRDNLQSEVAAAAPFIRTNPQSALNSPLGNQIAVIPPGVANGAIKYTDPVELVAWKGEDIDTKPVTITFAPMSYPPTVQAAGTNPAFPVGVVLFGTGGYLVQAEIDILLGAQLTVCASYVRLQVKLGGGFSTQGYQFTGMLSFNPCVRTAPLTKTVGWLGLANGANTGNLQIPAFAKNVIVRRSSPGNASPPFELTIADTNGSIVYFISVASGAEMSAPVEIPGSGYNFVLKNTDAANAGDFVATFQLGL